MAEEETPKGDDKTFSQADMDAAIEKATGGLKAKVEELLGEAKAAKAKAKEEAEAAAKAAEAKAKQDGDVEALTKSWEAKFAKLTAEKDAALEAATGTINTLTVGKTAAELAGQLAVEGSAPVLERIIRDRLAVDMKDGAPVVTVRDAAGKPSALTLQEFTEELKADRALAPLISASRASGGGAASTTGGAGGAKTVTRQQWDGMGHSQRSEFSKSGGKVVDA